MKDKILKQKKQKNIQFTIAIVLTALAIVSTVTLAWFSWQTKITSVVKIKNPSVIQIMAGHVEDVTNLDIGNINLKNLMSDPIENSDGTYSKQYVFSVCAEKDNYNAKTYYIQIGYTTNIAFTYKLYKAEELNTPINSNETYSAEQQTNIKNGTYTEYITEDRTKKYLYKKGEAINFIDITTELSDTYDDYSSVENHANPVYKKTDVITPGKTLSDDLKSDWEFVDYYILEVNWAKTLSETPPSTKETDMVYLVVYDS